MNKFNSEEFNPHGIPLPSNDFFSFLDNEIYYIGILENHECSRFIKVNEEGKSLTFGESDKTKFLFKWKETGYVICCADNPSLVLTMRPGTIPGSFFISPERYQNRADQIWEILPYKDSNSHGISIRSAMKQSGGYIYIGWDSYSVSPLRDMQEHTSLVLCPLSDWVTFGMACMQYLEWIYVTDNDIKKSLRNYYSNIRVNISAENAMLHNGTGVIVNQSGGNFSLLHYADVFMDGVACEVIAVCNAIRLVTRNFDETNADFFKLAVEFELSGLYDNSFKKLIVNTGTMLGIKRFSSISTLDGGWGGDPEKIGNCLEAHNINFRMINAKKRHSLSKSKNSEEALTLMEKSLEGASCAIVSYNFDSLHQAIHTYTCNLSDGKITALNRYSNYTPEQNYKNPDSDDLNRSIYSSLSETVKSEKDARFSVGYILYNK